MTLPDIWRDVGKRIGFFTKETQGDIPDAAGCYAWFIPLWIYVEDLADFVGLLNKAMTHDAKTSGVATATAHFSWDSVEVRVAKQLQRGVTDGKKEIWKKMLTDPEMKDAFQRALMEASILMPPLYVGRTENLSARYVEHVEGRGLDKNVFHSRFCHFAQTIDLPLTVGDLLFVCITTEATSEKTVREKHMSELLEHVLMLVSRPPFSER